MTYSHTNLGTFRTQLANRLGDTSNIFWTQAELDQYCREALRTWQVMSCFAKDRGTFVTVSGTAHYDLTSVTFNNGAVPAEALVSYTVTDQSVVKDIQAALLEPITGTNWSTSQFTLAQVTAALERRRNQFLYETGIRLTRSVIAAGSPPVQRVALSDSIIDLRRVAWIPVLGSKIVLWRIDEHAARTLFPTWVTNPGDPESYSLFLIPNVGIQMIPAISTIGSLELVTVNTGATLDPANGAGIVLGVPDNFTPYIKWGALADLLGQDGEARDDQRSQYCEQRWREGVELAKISPLALSAEINGEAVPVGAINDLDTCDANWINAANAQPRDIGLAGPNLLYLSPTPDAIYSVTLDVVRKMPVPTADADNLQVGREHLDAILDYAVHLAMFKCGGQEFQTTMAHYERLMRLAAEHNSRLAAEAEKFDILKGQSTEEDRKHPRRASA